MKKMKVAVNLVLFSLTMFGAGIIITGFVFFVNETFEKMAQWFM